LRQELVPQAFQCFSEGRRSDIFHDYLPFISSPARWKFARRG
jgi:hypothetical protein